MLSNLSVSDFAINIVMPPVTAGLMLAGMASPIRQDLGLPQNLLGDLVFASTGAFVGAICLGRWAAYLTQNLEQSMGVVKGLTIYGAITVGLAVGGTSVVVMKIASEYFQNKA